MTPLEGILLGLLWIILGLFICHKARWYRDRDDNDDSRMLSLWTTVIFSPIVFLCDFVNRFFIQKWHDD